MIKKTLIHAGLFLVMFAAVWLALSQIDFMRLFSVEKNTSKTEEKLGDVFWESIERSETVVKNDSVNDIVQKLVSRITDANSIDSGSINVHIIDKNEVNAFAMPGDHLILYTGLIDAAKNESQLAGVIGHEIAHIEKKHVMKKLAKEIGFSVLLSMTTGGHGSQGAREAVKMLSSSAYDRNLESEADFASVDYLINAKVDPAPFADFLFSMSVAESMPSAVYWIATHPESEQRAKSVIDYIEGKKFETKPVLSAAEWRFLKSKARD